MALRQAHDGLSVENRRPTAVMRAEAVPWRCHRRLIAEALVVRGWTVRNILSETRADTHALTTFAPLESGKLQQFRPYCNSVQYITIIFLRASSS
jgi:uncharacterized protein (DUF488 family)